MNEIKIINIKEEMEELKRVMNDISVDFVNDHEIDNDSSYLCDLFTSYADSNVDIYYSDLFEWCKDNFEYVNQAMEEFGGCGNDIIQAIRQGQFLYNERMLYQDEEEIIEYLVLKYIYNTRDYIEETLLRDILDNINNNTCERLSKYQDEIEYILVIEDDEDLEEETEEAEE